MEPTDELSNCSTYLALPNDRLSAKLSNEISRILADRDLRNLAPQLLKSTYHALHLWGEEPLVLLTANAILPVLEVEDVMLSGDLTWTSDWRSDYCVMAIAHLTSGDTEHLIVFLLFLILALETDLAVDTQLRAAVRRLRAAFELPSKRSKNVLNAEERDLCADCLTDTTSAYDWRIHTENLQFSLKESGTSPQILRVLKDLRTLLDCVNDACEPHVEEILSAGPRERNHYATTNPPIGAWATNIARLDEGEILEIQDANEDEVSSTHNFDLADGTDNQDTTGAAPSRTNSWSVKEHSTVLSKSLLDQRQRQSLGEAAKANCLSIEKTLRDENALDAYQIGGLAVILALIKPCNPHDDELLDASLFAPEWFPEGKFASRRTERLPTQYIPAENIAHLYSSPVTDFNLLLPDFLSSPLVLLHEYFGDTVSLRHLFETTGCPAKKSIASWLDQLATDSRTPRISLRSFANELREFATAEFDLPLHTVYCLFAAPNHSPTTDAYYASIKVSRLRELLLEIINRYFAGHDYV